MVDKDRSKSLQLLQLERNDSTPYSRSYNNFTTVIDNNLQWFRRAPYVLLGVGCLIIGRKLRVLTQFKTIADIPTSFLNRHISLRGCVTRISHDGTIYIRHVPIIRLQRLRTIVNEGNTLNAIPIKLIGLRMPDTEQTKLQRELEKLQNAVVWFQLWHVDQEEQDDGSLYCLVSTPKWPFNRCVNMDLLRDGMVEYEPLSQVLTEQKRGLALARRMVKAQNYAMSKRRGMWHGPTKLAGYVASTREGYAQIQPKQLGKSISSNLRLLYSYIMSKFKGKPKP